MKEATSLASVLARQLRVLREERGLRQDDIAAAAQDHGLQWSQSTVASVETGRRALAADELLLMPLLIGCRLEDLLCAGNERVEIRPGFIIPCRELRRLLSGDFRQPDVVRPRGARGPTREVRLGPVTEDVRRVARGFGITNAQVQAVAYSLFRQPLRDERDARVARLLDERGERRPSATRVRALRGRVMRDLMDELRPVLAPAAPDLEPTDKDMARAFEALRQVADVEGEGDE